MKQHQDDLPLTTPLSEFDWNFNNVPEGEIIGCCVWEYARESKTLALASAMHWCNVRDLQYRGEYKRNPKLKIKHNEIAARFERQAKAAGFDYEAFLGKFWSGDPGFVDIFGSLRKKVWDGALPWGKLPERDRSLYAEQVSQSDILRPVSQSLVGELERLWNANREELDEVRAHPLYDDSEDAALHAETAAVTLTAEEPAEAPGKIVVAFTVDFTRFTDGEICDEVKRWLAANRPPDWKTPKRVFPDSKQRGRKRAGKLLEYHTALNRLGLMRLLHWHTPAEIQCEWPGVWKKYQSKRADFRREVRGASRFFRKLFPFLPDQERPVSEERKGIWFPKMLKIAEEVERDMGLI